MTLRPVEPVRIGKGLKEHTLLLPKEQMCQAPGCDYLATDRHHCVPGGMGGPRYDFLEIDGVMRQNVVFLCVLCHADITQNKAKIVWDDGEWCWNEYGVSLDPPLDATVGLGLPPAVSVDGCVEQEKGGGTGRVSTADTSRPHPAPGLTEGGGTEADGVRLNAQPDPAGAGGYPVIDRRATGQAPSVSPGETCPTCSRRVNHPRKADSPTSKPVSFRVPADEADNFTELFSAAAEHLGISGAKYEKKAVVEAGLVLILQGPARELAA